MIMEEIKLRKLINRIIIRRYVNLYADGNALDTEIIDDMIDKITGMQEKVYCIAVDIKSIPVGDEKQEADYLKDIVNEEMAKKQFPHWIHEANTIEHLLHQLNERLEDPALIIFYQFTSPEDEKEKDLLRSLRKFIQMRESLLLGLLLISSQKLGKWDLHHYSDIDERVVEYFFHK
jgi:hypothetical protein